MTEEQLIKEIRKMYPTDTSVEIFVSYHDYDIHRNRKLTTDGSSWTQIGGLRSPHVDSVQPSPEG